MVNCRRLIGMAALLLAGCAQSKVTPPAVPEIGEATFRVPGMNRQLKIL